MNERRRGNGLGASAPHLGDKVSRVGVEGGGRLDGYANLGRRQRGRSAAATAIATAVATTVATAVATTVAIVVAAVKLDDHLDGRAERPNMVSDPPDGR